MVAIELPFLWSLAFFVLQAGFLFIIPSADASDRIVGELVAIPDSNQGRKMLCFVVGGIV